MSWLLCFVVGWYCVLWLGWVAISGLLCVLLSCLLVNSADLVASLVLVGGAFV